MIPRSHRYAVDTSTGERINNIRYVRGKPYNDFEAEIQEDYLIYDPQKERAYHDFRRFYHRAISG